MRRSVIAVVALVMVTVPHAMASSASSSLRVAGDVRTGMQPVDSALVISFGLSSFSAVRTLTDASGAFDFPPQPAGAYRVIAVKSGFAPAVATVSPTAENRPLRLVLQRGNRSSEASEQIWEIRRSLPSDILRELDAALAPIEVNEDPAAAFEGEMKSLTSIDAAGNGGSLAQTHLALSSSLPAGWRVDIDGSHTESSQQPLLDGDAAARGLRSSGVAVSLSSQGDARVQVASRSNMFTDTDDREVALESHRIEWSRPGTELTVQYRDNDNVLPERYGQGAFEFEGETRIWANERSDVGIGIRFIQASSSDITRTGDLRLADLSTAASHRFGERLEIRYGVSARIGVDELASWSPETTALLRLTDNTSLIIGGQVKMSEAADGWMVWPAVVQFEDTAGGFSTPRYRYGLGLVSGRGETSELSALVSITEIDDPTLIVFDDLAADVWDAYVLETGDRHEELKVRYRRNFVSDRIALDVHGHAARTQGLDQSTPERSIVQSRVRSIYIPSGTSLEVSYRKLDQPEREGIAAFGLEGERLNLRMGQSLHLPLDLTVLFGVDLVRADEVSELNPDELRHRYVGGVAFAF